MRIGLPCPKPLCKHFGLSPNGKKVLVSNSYGSYDNIPTKWVSVSYMKKKFGDYDTSLVVRLNYTLSESKKSSVNCFYNSMGTKWNRHGPFPAECA